MSHLSVAFVLFPNVTQLDLTGPAQVLSRLSDATCHLVATSHAPVATDAGFSIVPTTTFGELPRPDIICVPGGAGADDAMEDPVVLEWLRTASASAQWITSVCTGSLVLGAAGLLKGKRATSHWAARAMLEHFGATPVDERVVFDGNLVTGGGVTAGIDFALALMAELRGPDHARLVQLALEYDPHPPFDAGSPASVDPTILNQFSQLSQQSQVTRERRVIAAAAKI
tara:strand:- start:271 stop:951 length:681 start_codon:yes stop_codon:yes gene_type:complete